MVNNQNCFAVNFGYSEEISFPAVSLPLDSSQNLKQYNLENSYKCYFVFLGGKYAQDMKSVVDIVEDITEHFHGVKPVSMFLMGRFSTALIHDLSFYKQEITKVP